MVFSNTSLPQPKSSEKISEYIIKPIWSAHQVARIIAQANSGYIERTDDGMVRVRIIESK